ncbi:hypothetical protein [uncultured Bosea sp.]|uniref:hypothetical protein n=1 Tax=uncultured Bosea sp. TaxID=211457 RepID=UPI0025DF77EF|nr:hypothetical protein [uncultured Bosea sp.]
MDLITPFSKTTDISSLAFIPALEGDAFQVFIPQALRAIAAIADGSELSERLTYLAQDLRTDQSAVVGLHGATSGNTSCQRILDTLALTGGTDRAAQVHLAGLGDAVHGFVEACAGPFEPQGYQRALIALTLRVDLIRITAAGCGGHAAVAPMNSKDEAFYCVHNALASTLMELNVQPVGAYDQAMRLIMMAAPDFVPDLTASQVPEDRAA